MKILLLGNDIINFQHVNNIRPAINPMTEKFRIKVHMVNGSAFETEDIYTEEQAVSKIADISIQLTSNQKEIIIQ